MQTVLLPGCHWPGMWQWMSSVEGTWLRWQTYLLQHSGVPLCHSCYEPLPLALICQCLYIHVGMVKEGCDALVRHTLLLCSWLCIAVTNSTLHCLPGTAANVTIRSSPASHDMCGACACKDVGSACSGTCYFSTETGVFRAAHCLQIPI